MMRPRLCWLLLPLLTGPLQAQESELPPVRVGPVVGYVDGLGDGFRPWGGDWAFGGKLGVQLSGRFELLAGLEYAAGCYPDPIVPAGGAAGGCIEDASLFRAYAEPRLLLGPSWAVAPFAGLRAGFVRQSYSAQEHGIEVGGTGGAVIRLSDILALEVAGGLSRVRLGASVIRGTSVGSPSWGTLVFVSLGLTAQMP